MEVGAVKQAFNNEVILLKNKLNQAKIHVIHKLTRKAKTLATKTTSEKLQQKLRHKAESAVNEVLIIKKIKTKDIAKFIITHTGNLQDYLNRPKVDTEKACARLVLHKSLQDKYNYLRNRFGNVPIKDLFMSRQERRKIKKEARNPPTDKKKKKERKVTNAVGDWVVEDIDIIDKAADTEIHDDNVSKDGSVSPDICLNQDSDATSCTNEENSNQYNQKADKDIKKEKLEVMSNPDITSNIENVDLYKTKTTRLDEQKKKRNSKDVNKNKNLIEKLQSRRLKKNLETKLIEDRKVVDPFFITASGNNYMSLAEPRPPDEVKEIHKQGNRKERRAAMFGHVLHNKPRKPNFKQFHNDNRLNNKSQTFENKNFNYNKHKDKSMNGDKNATVEFHNSKLYGKKQHFSDKNIESKEEKLHPSWEAKKKQSSILPFKGKKTVFDEN